MPSKWGPCVSCRKVNGIVGTRASVCVCVYVCMCVSCTKVNGKARTVFIYAGK